MIFDSFSPVSPHYSSKSEKFLLLFADISGLIDDKGRRLQEAAFRSEQENEAFKSCPFAGSRHGKLMNQSAFHDIFSDWEDILATQSLLRQAFLSSGEPAYTEPGEMWQMALLPLFAPVYWRLSSADSDSSILPSVIAGLYKIALGIPSTIEIMILQQEAASGTVNKNSMAMPHIFAEKYGLLTNEKWACAGPPNMMKIFDEALIGTTKINISKHQLPFKAQFETSKYAQFCFIMTCQYICGRFFWLYDILLMEHAFTALTAKDAYSAACISAHATSSTTPETRRRLILPVLIKNKSVLDKLSLRYIKILRESQRLTNFTGGLDVVREYLGFLSHEFKSVDINSATSLLNLRDRFSATLFQVVQDLRSQLSILMQIKNFKDFLELPMEFDSPADNLRSILNSQNNQQA